MQLVRLVEEAVRTGFGAPGGDAPPPVSPPGYLGLVVDEARRIVQRGSGQVDFGGNVIFWELFYRLFRQETGYLDRDVMYREVWPDPAGASVENGSIYSTVSRTRKMLEPIGVTIKHRKGLGYRLEELTEPIN
jgi:DNA-binding response OmpR family regulator